MTLTHDNYFSPRANKQFMSVSQFKQFVKCEALAQAELNGSYEREITAALLIGSYVDAYFEGTLDAFQKEHPEIYTRNGSLKSDYKHAEYIIERISRDPFFMKYMSGSKQIIMTGKIERVPIKVKLDVLHPDKLIVDLKIVRDFKPIYDAEYGWQNFITSWGYDLQGAVYQEIVRQNTGKQLPFVIAAATKEKEPDIGIFEIPQSYLDARLAEFKANLPRFAELKRGIGEPIRCESCNHCRRTKVLSGIKSMEELEAC